MLARVVAAAVVPRSAAISPGTFVWNGDLRHLQDDIASVAHHLRADSYGAAGSRAEGEICGDELKRLAQKVPGALNRWQSTSCCRSDLDFPLQTSGRLRMIAAQGIVAECPCAYRQERPAFLADPTQMPAGFDANLIIATWSRKSKLLAMIFPANTRLSAQTGHLQPLMAAEQQ
jgi:hypothetical protein